MTTSTMRRSDSELTRTSVRRSAPFRRSTRHEGTGLATAEAVEDHEVRVGPHRDGAAAVGDLDAVQHEIGAVRQPHVGVDAARRDMATHDWHSPRRSACQLWLDFVNNHRNPAFALDHDGGNRRPTPDGLPNIIQSGLQLGYRFVTATELMLSGTPQPVTSTSRYADTDDVGTFADDLADGPADANPDGYVDRCNHEAEAELVAALDDPSITDAERMRIVDVLADIEAAKLGG